jgi:hypothetical protein
MSKGAVLFDDIFEIKARDPDGKKFDKGGLAAMQACKRQMLSGSAQVPSQALQPLGSPLPSAVSRYVARSDLYECDLTLDVNTDVYPLEVGQVLFLQRAVTMSLGKTCTCLLQHAVIIIKWLTSCFAYRLGANIR